MEERSLLIVEDEQKIADTLKLGLAENGYHVEVAYDGAIGYRLFQQHLFSLIILDVNLPGINGYELCKRIRSENPHIPIIMLTALGGLSDKIEGYDSGADDYMLKPFEFKELLLKIRALLKRTMNQNLPVGSLLKAADLEMNMDSKEVKRNEQPINLTAKVLKIVYCFSIVLFCIGFISCQVTVCFYQPFFVICFFCICTNNFYEFLIDGYR